MSVLTTVRIDKDNLDLFEKSVEETKKDFQLVVELTERGKDGSSFFRIDCEADALFGLGYAYGGLTTLQIVKAAE